MSSPPGKRLMDLVLGGGAFFALSPVYLLLALFVRIFLGKGVFFRQTRPGLHGKPFVIHKFRTMTEGRDASGALLPDSLRLTRFGRWLRSTSLDELPELFDVLRGEMSLVGPRPLLMHYLPLYSPEERRRHEAPPGITGWAQVNGRNAISWEEKFRLDLWYVDHRSLRLDIAILALTVRNVLRREGIAQPGRATMEEFRGNPA
jgi:lipopolysaccharide/colanic/teichoic acid biosynthesis glycosyltransferase